MRILGTGSYLPKLSVTNDEISEIVDTNHEWIVTRTGIESRHICTDERITDLAYGAAVNALDMAGIKAEELDTIICTTVSGDYMTPSMASLLNKRLGVACRSFDLNAACSGFIYALEISETLLKCKRAKKILLVSAENMTRLSDWNDRSTCVLFGDGAGAVVLGEGEDLLSLNVTSSGNEEILNIHSIPGNSPFDKTEWKADKHFLHMNGREVYKFAIAASINDITKAAEDAGISIESLDYILLHQANLRIIKGVQKRFGIPDEKYLHNIEHCGNTSSATLPILIDEEARNNRFKKGDLLAMAAFGGGLTSSACIIRWSI